MDQWQNKNFVQHWDTTHLEGNPVRQEQLEIIKYFVEKRFQKGLPIIDIGIGSGIIEKILLDSNDQMNFYGIDSSQAMYDIAQKRLQGYMDNITYILEDLEHISTIEFPATNGNIALSIQTLHNLKNQIKSTIYDRVMSWLLPGGIFIIMDRIRPYPPATFSIYKTYWNYLEEKYITIINEGEDYDDHAKTLEEKGDYPLTLLENIIMLERVGFKTATIHVQGNRAIFIGIKSIESFS